MKGDNLTDEELCLALRFLPKSAKLPMCALAADRIEALGRDALDASEYARGLERERIRLNPTEALDWPERYEQLEKRAMELERALVACVAVAKGWHGPVVWDIYYNNSPEMKPIREILGPAGLVRED